MADELIDETIFTWGAPPLKFGAGAADEIGFELAQYAVGRVLIVTDPRIAELGTAHRIADTIRRYDITVEIFDGVHVEPTDDSIAKAAGYAAQQGPWDGFVAVGGGSSIDTAKAINLLTTHPGELMDYVNKPVGLGKTPPGPLKPLIAVPTTAGTGSESTATCVLDVLSMRVKTGISHWRLRPTMAVVDPLLTMTLPPEVTASAGMDIVCHYYTRVAPVLLPHLADRPVTMIRYPDGVNHPAFFEKNIPRGAPDWLPRDRLPSTGTRGRGEAIEYPLISDLPALVVVT